MKKVELQLYCVCLIILVIVCVGLQYLMKYIVVVLIVGLIIINIRKYLKKDKK